MKLPTLEIGMMLLLRPGMLCLILLIAACSHRKVEATEPAKAESAEATIPAVPEAAQPEPVLEKPGVNAIAINEIAILNPGQSARVHASTTLHYLRLVSDSRCPVGTQCIWAGEATIELTLESGKEKQTFTLTDRANSKSVMGFSIELVSIDRSHLINIWTQKL
jgi:hypothetical protein